MKTITIEISDELADTMDMTKTLTGVPYGQQIEAVLDKAFSMMEDYFTLLQKLDKLEKTLELLKSRLN